MSFKAKIKKPGDIIRSEDWNEAMIEIENLENHKIGVEGGALSGPLKITYQLGLVGDSNEWAIDGLEKDQLKIKSGDRQKLVISDRGGVGVGMENPNPGLAVDGPVIRKVWMTTNLGPNDDKSEGLINGRVLDFQKYRDETAIRIIYCDNFRVRTTSEQLKPCSGRWEILIDGMSSPGGSIYQDFYSVVDKSGQYKINNIIRPSTIVGYSIGLSKGKHQITVRVGDVSGRPDTDSKDRLTGWNKSRWTIEAEEVWVQ